MIIYVMRHAEAVEENNTLPDEWRYLTEKGRLTAKKMSGAIARYGSKPRLTITSPLTRAVQTAEIAAEKACRKNVVIASALLLPGADINELVGYIKSCRDSKRIMVVGHEPQLGLLVAALLGCSDSSVTLKKGACVTLKYNANAKAASFLWYLSSDKRRVTSFKKAFPQQPA